MKIARAIFVAAVGLFAIGLILNAYALDYVASLVSARGDVKVDIKGDGDWAPARVGAKLQEGSKIKTASRSYAEIAFDEDQFNNVDIEEETAVVIESPDRMKLSTGRLLVFFLNMEPGSKFEVKTPTAVCGIRGSNMGVEFLRGFTNCFAFRGFVYTRGIGVDGRVLPEVIQVPVGMKSRIMSNENPDNPVKMTRREKKMWKMLFGVIVEGDEGAPSKIEEPEEEEEEEASP